MKENNFCILIVDDDLDLLMLLERRLVQKEFIVETAASISEAEEILEYFPPHLVLVDVNINGEDGRKLCWKVKHNQYLPNTKVFIMSGFDISLTRSALFGADDVIAKPFDIDFLLLKISELIGHKV